MSQIVPPSNKVSKGVTELDKLLRFYDRGRALTPELEAKRLLLEEAWDLLRARGQAGAVKLLLRKHEISKPTAYKMVRECQELFGQVTKTSKEAKRAMLSMKLERLASKAEKAQEYDKAIKAIAEIAKLNRLDQPDDDDTEQIKLPTVIVITSDPGALVQTQIEDKPYEGAD